MIELTMSNGEYLTHEDLEKYLNEYEDFYRKNFADGMLEFEYKALINEHNDRIVKSINSFDKIGLILSDIRIDKKYKPFGIGGHLNENSITLRGEEIGEWGILQSNEQEVYVLSFNEIVIKNPQLPPYKSKGTTNGHSVPKINFYKITTIKPTEIRKGSRYTFKVNILSPTRYLRKEEYIFVDYVEKINVKPGINEGSNHSNSNCFIVTATMGDVKHPVVNDFRMFRDNILLKTFLGRLFISIYYKIGPYLANLIKSNHFLLHTSKNLILYLHRKIK